MKAMGERVLNEQKNKFVAVDILKCISILLVIFVHSGQQFKQGNALHEVSKVGQLGVQTFFVISGFTLSRSWDKKSVKSFYIKRLTKIAPGYYFAIAFFFILTFSLRKIGIYLYWEQNQTVPALLSNVLFLHGFFPQFQNTVVPGGWYIGTTMIFYAAFPWTKQLLDYTDKKCWKIQMTYPMLATWIAVLAWAIAERTISVELIGNNSLLYFSAITQFPCFLAGMIANNIYDRICESRDEQGKLTYICSVLGIGAAVITLQLFYCNWVYGYAYIPLFAGICSANILIVLLIKLDCSQLNLNGRIMCMCRAVSAVSYEMYLLHCLYAFFLIWAVRRAMPRLGVNTNSTVFFLGCYIVNIIITYYSAKILHICLKKWPTKKGKVMSESKTIQTLFSSRQRDMRFDVARGIGIVLMVMGHTGFGNGFNKIIHTFHMPLFFFLSGYFYRPEKFSGFMEYCAHQMKTLLIPYIVFCMFYQPLHVIYTGEFSVRYMLLSLISSNHNRIDVAGAMWFLLCLFSAKIIYYVMDVSIKGRKAFTIIIIIFTLLGNCLRMICTLPFAMDSAMSCLAVMHIGVLFCKNREQVYVKKALHMPWRGFILMMAVFLVATFVNQPVNIRRNVYGNIALYWISCLSGILLIMNMAGWITTCSSEIVKKIGRGLSFFGRESLVYLILNELTIYVVEVGFMVIGISKPLMENNYLMKMVVVVTVMSILALVSIVVEATPLKILFGKSRKDLSRK